MAPMHRRLAIACSLAFVASFAACNDDNAGESRASSGTPPSSSTTQETPEAGSPIDAANDTTTDAAPEASADPCKDRIICDSFETATVGAAPGGPWKTLANSGTVAVTDALGFQSTKSVKLTTTAATYQRAMLTTTGAPLFPLAMNKLYGRMMVRLENAAGNNVHWNMISARGPVPGHTGVNGSYNYGGQFGTYLANYDTMGASTDCWKHSTKSLPIGAWACVAWAFTGATNELQLYTHDGEITDMHVTNKGEGCLGHDLSDVWAAPTFQTASVGWESVQSDPGHTMYVDDVILDDAPITCP